MWVFTHQIFFTYLRRKIPQYLEALSHVQLLMLSLKFLTKCWLDRFIKTFSSQVGTSGQNWDNAAINNMEQYFHGGKHYTSDGFKECITLSNSVKVNPSCYSFHREGQSPLCHERFIAEQPWIFFLSFGSCSSNSEQDLPAELTGAGRHPVILLAPDKVHLFSSK